MVEKVLSKISKISQRTPKLKYDFPAENIYDVNETGMKRVAPRPKKC